MPTAFLSVAAVAALVAALAEPARAHITLEQPTAPADSWYRAVFRVPHGCGEAATIRLTVFLPEAITRARPMPKSGWTVHLTPRADAPPPSGHGVTPELSAITWEGGPLPNAFYDEFIIRFRTPSLPGVMWIPVRQECEGGLVIDWAETPADGARAAHPAPRLTITPR